MGALLVRLRVRREVDAFEHEGAKREHRFADLVALADLAGALGGLDEIVDDRVDPAGARRAEQLDLRSGKPDRLEPPPPPPAVEVGVYGGAPVGGAGDLAFRRSGLAPAARA